MATAEAKRKTGKWTDTPFGIRGESTPVSSGSYILGSEGTASTLSDQESLHLKVELANLKADIEDLKAKVAALQATNSPEKVLEVREIPREQAKEEIRAFFRDHHGKAIYPSDVMEALSLDYDLVYGICEELEKDGAVKGL
jgi:hypothetical protein